MVRVGSGEVMIELTTLLSLGGFIVVLVGGLIARDRYVSRQIREGDDALHERINRVRDDMVHKDAMDTHLLRLDRTLQEMREEQREYRREAIALLGQLLGKKGSV